MAATTLSGATWVDGPSGTVVTNARLQSDIYAPVNAVLAGNLIIGGTIGSEGFGSHNYSAAGTGANQLTVRNSSAGTTHKGVVAAQGDGAGILGIEMFSSTHSTNGSGSIVASGGRLVLSGSGALSIETVTGAINWFPAGAKRAGADFTNGLISENDYGLRIKNTGGTAIDGVILTSANELRIGSDSSAAVVDTVIKAGASMRFRTNSGERVVVDNAGNVTPGANGSQDFGSTSFRWNDLWANNLRSGDITLENDFIITEHDKVGIAMPGVAICRPGDKHVVAFLDRFGDLYLAGQVMPMRNLPGGGPWLRS